METGNTLCVLSPFLSYLRDLVFYIYNFMKLNKVGRNESLNSNTKCVDL